MENIETLKLEFFDSLPFLMASNLNDDIDYNPRDNLSEYIQNEILPEIEYEREENYQVYSKNEMDRLEGISRKLLKAL